MAEQEQVPVSPDPADTGRLFFGALLPRSLQAAVEVIQRALRQAEADVKWVEPHHLHFTLKFLGDTPLDAVPELAQVGRQVAGELSRCRVMLRGVGGFPHSDWPQVVWVGCTEGREDLAQIAHRLDAALAEVGLATADRRPFEPHLTLGRARSNKQIKPLVRLVHQMEQVEVGPLLVGGFTLMQSELTPAGPVYHVLDKFPFGA